MNRLEEIKRKLISGANSLSMEDVIWMIDTIDKLLEINEELRPKTWVDSEGQIHDRS